jgi:hypothetical protein
MPLSKSGKKILKSMQKQYGEKKGKGVFYASMNLKKPGTEKWHKKSKKNEENTMDNVLKLRKYVHERVETPEDLEELKQNLRIEMVEDSKVGETEDDTPTEKTDAGKDFKKDTPPPDVKPVDVEPVDDTEDDERSGHTGMQAGSAHIKPIGEGEELDEGIIDAIKGLNIAGGITKLLSILKKNIPNAIIIGTLTAGVAYVVNFIRTRIKMVKALKEDRTGRKLLKQLDQLQTETFRLGDQLEDQEILAQKKGFIFGMKHERKAHQIQIKLIDITKKLDDIENQMKDRYRALQAKVPTVKEENEIDLKSDLRDYIKETTISANIDINPPEKLPAGKDFKKAKEPDDVEDEEIEKLKDTTDDERTGHLGIQAGSADKKPVGENEEIDPDKAEIVEAISEMDEQEFEDFVSNLSEEEVANLEAILNEMEEVLPDDIDATNPPKIGDEDEQDGMASVDSALDSPQKKKHTATQIDIPTDSPPSEEVKVGK